MRFGIAGARGTTRTKTANLSIAAVNVSESSALGHRSAFQGLILQSSWDVSAQNKHEGSNGPPDTPPAATPHSREQPDRRLSAHALVLIILCPGHLKVTFFQMCCSCMHAHRAGCNVVHLCVRRVAVVMSFKVWTRKSSGQYLWVYVAL